MRRPPPRRRSRLALLHSQQVPIHDRDREEPRTAIVELRGSTQLSSHQLLASIFLPSDALSSPARAKKRGLIYFNFRSPQAPCQTRQNLPGPFASRSPASGNTRK